MTMESIRIDLPDNFSREGGTNIGLWYQKYLDRSKKQPEQVLTSQIDDKMKNQIPEAYHRFYTTWKGNLINCVKAVTVVGTTNGRMAVNLGADSVAEVNVAIHHTYGVPYIPGSALKGLASHFAATYLGEEWKKGSKAHTIVFGTTDAAGYCTFFDALYVPDTKNKKPFRKDVMTIHHQNYYTGTNDSNPPADWDNTIIVPFLSVNGKFLFAIAGPNDEWKAAAMEILKKALVEEGVGGKTNSDYGKFIFN